MRVWHSAWSWLKLMVAAESVAGKDPHRDVDQADLQEPFPRRSRGHVVSPYLVLSAQR